ncbi:hypothetical protein [uncultured Azohydromonas sp.]|uniref:hypothetical protein n=1 Tax=uncultured Azohydromonas sp. TaxID=487342 RepID=UPI002639C131|nr:hypothetical protein [uncultured Azohydromonas sp.]
MKHISPRALVTLLLAGAAAQVQAQAQAQDGTVYQCAKPGQPQLFTDAAGARQARERGFDCQAMLAVPVTVPQGPRSRGAGAPARAAPAESVSAAAVAASVPRGGERGADAQQRARDNDARAILQTELQREQARLQQLLAEYNDGRPERRGDERNYQRYLDRVAALKASIERSSADIAALQRELARLTRP